MDYSLAKYYTNVKNENKIDTTVCRSRENVVGGAAGAVF